MKQNYSFQSSFLLVVVMHFMLLLSSCNNYLVTKEVNSVNNNKSSILRRTQTNNCDFQCMQEYVEAHSDLFGSSVFIFETIEDALDFVDSLSNMSLAELEEAYSMSGVQSPVLNSIIYWEQGEELYGLNDMSQSEMEVVDDNLYNQFYQYLCEQPTLFQEVQIEDEYWSNYVESFTLGDTTDLNSAIIEPTILSPYQSHVMPLGGFDLTALLNENNVFVAGGCAYSKKSRSMVHVPLEYYFQLAQETEEEGIVELLDFLIDSDLDAGRSTILGILDNENPTPGYGGLTRWCFYNHDNHFKLQVEIDFDYARYRFFGNYTKRRMEMNVRNFIWKKGKWFSKNMNTSGNVSCIVHDSYMMYNFSFDYLNRKVKNYTKTKLYDIVPLYCYPDYFSGVHINMTNGQNVICF